MRIFDVEYHFYRTWRMVRFNLMKQRRLRGYVVPPWLKQVLLMLLLGIFVFFLVIFCLRLNKVRLSKNSTPPSVQEEASVSMGPLVHQIPDAPSGPELTAKSALVIETSTGQTLYEKNTEEPLPPASITKILTALLAVENYKMDEKVTVPPQCVGLAGSLIGLTAGEVWSVKEMLYGMLVPSASDATCALATHVAQLTDYVAAMNLRAQSLGLKQTRFANPIGLEDPNHRSSAKDLIVLGRVAMENDVIREIVVTPSIELHGRKILSTNELLGKVEGLVGVKTGFTEEAEECFLFAVERDGRSIMGVVLGSEDRFGEARKLIDWTYQTHVWETIR